MIAGKSISETNAKKVCSYFKEPFAKLFIPVGADKTLEGRTIKSHGRLIISVLNKAVQWGYIPDNPAKNAPLPKVEYKEAHFLDDKEIKTLLIGIQNAPMQYKTMVNVVVYSGVRLGELCGLEWHDIDFENHTISIRRVSQSVSGKGTITKEPKTKQSIRTIACPMHLFVVLKEFKAWQAEKRLQMGDLWHDTNRLFTKDNGLPIYPGSLGRWLGKYIKDNKIELPPFTIHSLRHAYATIMLGAQVDYEVVSKNLGHSQTSTTLNIYGHAIASAAERAADIMGAKLDISHM